MCTASIEFFHGGCICPGYTTNSATWQELQTFSSLSYDIWYNIVVSVNLTTRRVMTLMNGRRIKDAGLSPMFVAVNQKTRYEPSLAFRLLHSGWRVPARGYSRDVVIYNRAINQAEMIELAAKYGDRLTPAPVAPDTSAKEQLNKAYLQAVVNGNLPEVKKTPDAGADINAIYQDWSALNLASYYGREEMVKHLIFRQIDVLHEVRPGLNSQELARNKGFKRIVALLENASNTPRFFVKRKIGSLVHRSMVPDLPVFK